MMSRQTSPVKMSSRPSDVRLRALRHGQGEETEAVHKQTSDSWRRDNPATKSTTQIATRPRVVSGCVWRFALVPASRQAANVLPILAFEAFRLSPEPLAAARARRGSGVVGVVLEGLECLAGLRDVVFVVDPDGPAVGRLDRARGHAHREEIVAEDLGVRRRRECADLSQRRLPSDRRLGHRTASPSGQAGVATRGRFTGYEPIFYPTRRHVRKKTAPHAPATY